MSWPANQSSGSATVCLGLGSNLGDRQGHIEFARDQLSSADGISGARVSAIIETEPVGPAGQRPYLNAASVFACAISPRDLLELLLSIERQRGRVRRERWGPRSLDLDLLLFGNVVVSQPGLVIPHPRMHERNFVLQPLASIAPTAVHPILNRTVRELLQELS